MSTAHIINWLDLPGKTGRTFQGFDYGDVPVSLFVSETPLGYGPRLHQHPYAEVFVIYEGTLLFTVGEEQIEGVPGQIVVVPPNTPHKFTTTSAEGARHLDIHTDGKMATTWLE